MTQSIQNTNQILEAALRYYDLGLSVIPVGRNKKPLIDWKPYQTERANKDQIREWVSKFPDMNVAIVTGAVSNIVVIDIEKGGNSKGYPLTVASKTGGGGWHYYYKHPGGIVKNSVKNLAELTDVRGDGGYVVAPPSIHNSGMKYEWSIDPRDEEFAKFPLEMLKKKEVENGGIIDWKEFIKTPVLEGERNNSAAKYIGKLLIDVSESHWESVAWSKVQLWNQSMCKPPLSEQELRSVFDSIKTKEQNRPDRKSGNGDDMSQVELIVQMIVENPEILLFHDEYMHPHARIKTDGHAEIWACDSRRFQLWISHVFRKQTGKIPNNNAVSTALSVIEAKAVFEGDEYKLHNRTANRDGEIWYDLANKEWSAIKITCEGYSKVIDLPILFRRYSHLAPQVEPQNGGEVKDVLSFVNITDPDQQLLFMVYLVSCFIPGFAHPIPYVYGPQGSAKSSVSSIARKLVDPSRLGVFSMPRQVEELVQQLSHHHFLFYDNVSYITPEVSDLLCRAVTGSGFSKRKLYTNDEDMIFNILANIGINGINLSAVQPDLLERSLLFELDRVKDSDRKEMTELLEKFEIARPKILGAIFKTVSIALKLKPGIKLQKLNRMADFTSWGCAIAEALGYPRDAFLKAYERNIASQNEEALEGNVVATLFISFMDMGKKELWKGTPTELLRHIQSIAALEEINDRALPRKPNALTRQLNMLKPTLESAGFIVCQHREEKKRIITIKRVPGIGPIVKSSPEPEQRVLDIEPRDDSDDKTGI